MHVYKELTEARDLEARGRLPREEECEPQDGGVGLGLSVTEGSPLGPR